MTGIDSLRNSMPKFTCRYELDQRLDGELVALNESLYRSIPEILGSGQQIGIDEDGLPNAVHLYLLYSGALIYGAAEAALTLSLHNLGREARIHERQIFECWVRSKYYSDNPEIAKFALRAARLQEKKLLDELDYDRESERYRQLIEDCKLIESRWPETKRYTREPSLAQILNATGDDAEPRKFYSFHYRLPSQWAHGSFAGAPGVIRDGEVSFDSRLPDANFTIEWITTYLLAFIELLSVQLGRPDWANRFPSLVETWMGLQTRLHGDQGGLPNT